MRDRTEYMRRYYADNRERECARNRVFRLKRWGLSEADFTQLLADQGGGCAICGATEPGGRWNQWHIDHDHAVEAMGLLEVRGLLCNSCNVLLGHAGDDPERLLAATMYLRKNR